MPGNWAIHSARSLWHPARRKPNGKRSISDSTVPGRTPSPNQKRRKRNGCRFGEPKSPPPNEQLNRHEKSMSSLFNIRHALRLSADRQFRNRISTRFPPLPQTDVQTQYIRMATLVAKPNPRECPRTFHALGQITSCRWPTNRPLGSPAGVYGISKSFPVHFQGASRHSAECRPASRPNQFQRSGHCSSQVMTHAWPSHVRVTAKEFPDGFQSFDLVSSTARPGPGHPLSTSRPKHVQS
jgi:hypothetical protein